MPLILLLLVAAVFVVKFAWLLSALVVTVVVARVIGGWLARRDDRRLARWRRDAELCARADEQNRWFVAGDQRGVYGRYPPL